MSRINGYRYARRANGTKYRVYSGSRRGVRGAPRGKRPGYSKAHARKYTKRSFGHDTIMGEGAYYAKKSIGRPHKLSMGIQAPRVMNSNGRFVITHEEYLGDLNSSQAFVNTAFVLNPGLNLAQGGFTNWLPAIAGQFEQWKARGIVFTYKSTSSDAVLSTAANSALGTVSMATDYNVLNAAFANKVQMENYEHSVSCKPSCDMRHFIECARKQTPIAEQYVREGPVPANADARLYDLGLFQLAASGQQVAGGAMGEIWVSYTIEFFKPRIQPGIGGVNEDAVSFDHIQIYNAAKTTAGVLPATPFGTSTAVPLYPSSQSTLGGIALGGQIAATTDFAAQPSPTLNNFLGGVPVLANGLPTGALGTGAPNTYYFPPGVSSGNYLVTYNAVYGVTGTPAAPAFVGTNAQALLLFNNNGLQATSNAAATTTTTENFTGFLTITRANASFTLIGSSGMTTPTWADLIVTQIPSPIN